MREYQLENQIGRGSGVSIAVALQTPAQSMRPASGDADA